MPEREGETGGKQPLPVFPSWSGSAPWSSREGEKHEVMRARWNAWVNDMEHGPFGGIGGRIRLRELAAKAPNALGLGSSNTYRRYIDEDCCGGPLEKVCEGSVTLVRYRGMKSTDGDHSQSVSVPQSECGVNVR